MQLNVLMAEVAVFDIVVVVGLHSFDARRSSVEFTKCIFSASVLLIGACSLLVKTDTEVNSDFVENDSSRDDPEDVVEKNVNEGCLRRRADAILFMIGSARVLEECVLVFPAVVLVMADAADEKTFNFVGCSISNCKDDNGMIGAGLKTAVAFDDVRESVEILLDEFE